MGYDPSMRYLVLLLLVACSASNGDGIADADASQCEPGVRYTCSCGDRPEGFSVCTKAAKRGGCECGGAIDPPDEDGGAPDANCSSPTPFFRDVDGDGFGSGVATPACERPEGYAAVAGDCDDTDARAHPGQMDYFKTPRVTAPENLKFDFDCNNGTQSQCTACGPCEQTGCR
jgi:hypothetical protein